LAKQLKYLIDTNIWLESLLNQARAEEVRQFLQSVSSYKLLITDFSLHSIGVIMIRLNKSVEFIEFITDLFIDGSVIIVSVQPGEMQKLVAVINDFHLDFDDAYQYIGAMKTGSLLVSFDSDFDRTTSGRKTPAQILEAPELK
jgi:predicted nucleic acid-binding protein